MYEIAGERYPTAAEVWWEYVNESIASFVQHDARPLRALVADYVAAVPDMFDEAFTPAELATLTEALLDYLTGPDGREWAEEILEGVERGPFGGEVTPAVAAAQRMVAGEILGRALTW